MTGVIQPIQADFYPVTRRDELDVNLRGWLPTSVSCLPRWTVASKAFAQELQAVEDALYTVIVDTMVVNATAAALDRVGAVVGEQRLGLPDHAYRRFIQARIAINHSAGTRTDVANVLSILSGGVASARDAYPASVFGVVSVEALFSVDEARRVGRNARESLAGGIGSDFVATTLFGLTLSAVGATAPSALNGPPLAQVLG